jgi:hypothetical protein
MVHEGFTRLVSPPPLPPQPAPSRNVGVVAGSGEPGAMRSGLGWFALAVIVGMQAGTVFKPLGSVGSTRVADWIDLLTPFAVLGCASMVLLRANANREQWGVLGLGAVIFSLGHGLHLAANSVSNVDDIAVADASIVHLWDEVASHYIWYAGLFVVLTALALTLRGHDVRLGRWGIVLALLVAVTLVNTYIEGGVPWMGMMFLLAGVAAGLLWRPASVSWLLLIVGGGGVVLLVGWGAYWYVTDGTVFPQFSELGWI